MMLSQSIFLALSAIVMLAGHIQCNAQDNDVKLAEANNRFGLKLFKELSRADPESNIFFSPTSIAIALAMLYAGARGTTETELSTVLGHTAAGLTRKESALSCYKTLLQELQVGDVTLDLANAVLVDKRLKILESYSKNLVESFAAKFQSVDFATEAAAVVAEINEWVKNRTRGKIPDIAGKEITGATVMVLLNAVYFKGLWETSFNPNLTALRPFYNRGSQEVSVETMELSGKLQFTSEPDLKSEAIQLPYKGGRHCMVIVLPSKRKGLAELRNAMTLENIATIDKNLKETYLTLRLPKFKFETEYDLPTALMKLGLNLIFAGGDLSGITNDRIPAVSEVKHKAAIEVNEEGTVAAAATMVVMGKTTSSYFFADHPFLFYIREKTTGRVLFMGEVQEL
ncbi:unnamed protein product [Ixodes hexagonus]